MIIKRRNNILFHHLKLLSCLNPKIESRSTTNQINLLNLPSFARTLFIHTTKIRATTFTQVSNLRYLWFFVIVQLIKVTNL